MSGEKVVIVSGVRTPIASFRGSFAGVSSSELGGIAAKEAILRAGISPDAIEESFVGSVLTANCGQNVARQVAINAGIPKSSQAVTINKVCSSSMKALTLAALSIKSGYRNTTLVAGTENMSQVPYYIQRGETPYGGFQAVDGIAKDGLQDAMLVCPMGTCAEKSVKDYKISREAQDEFAVGSYKKAAAAWKEGKFAQEVMPVSIKQRRGADLVVEEDEEFKKLIESKVPSLSPVFIKDGSGTITAANASSLNDGAVAAVVTAGSAVPHGGFTVLVASTSAKALAEFVDFAEAGGEPVDFTIAPVWAAKQLLAKNNLTPGDVALWEVNEAFSVTVLAFIQELGIDPSKVNIKGGAVALGHPLGMSGLRIVLSLAHSLSPGQLGVAAICNGGGEAMAVLLRKL